MISIVKQSKVWKKVIIISKKRLLKKMNLDLDRLWEETEKNTKKNNIGSQE